MVTIRPARAEELDAVGEMTMRAYTEGGHLSETSDYGQVLRDTAGRAAEAELLVAAEEGEVLGTVTLAEPGGAYCDIAEDGELEFRMLAVAPSSAGRGIGRALVRAVVERARERGMRRVVLSSQASMTIAHRLYEALGFHREVDRDWRPAAHLELLVYALELR